MPTLNIKDAEVRQLAHELAARTGQTMTEAVKQALREKLQRERGPGPGRLSPAAERVLARAKRREQTPLLDTRSEDEILGYGKDGLPE
ncbi:MAG TPA: type II toxin-antitoxin system VapB family antitoxin [Terriglobales bacterium]